MEYWTNGHWKACIHRVLSDKKARLPFLYFTQADENTEIYPISQCAVCVSNGSNIEYQHVFGRSTDQFVREWQSKNH